jgi:hypothetical protein
MSATPGAARLQLDIFGNPICASEGMQMPPPGGDPNHVPDCCAPGCTACAAALAIPPETAFLFAGWFGMNRPGPSFDGVINTTGRRTPANPRAPPAVG